MEDEQWFLLGDALPKDALQLGSLVHDCKNPAQDYYFPEDLAGKQKQLVQRYKNYEATLEFAGHAKRSSFLKIIPKSDDSSDTVHLVARESCIYQLQNPWTWLETIGDLADAPEWLLKYSKDHRDIYLLTGFRTLRNGVLSRIVTRKKTEYSAGVAMPVSNIRGIPSVTAGITFGKPQIDTSSFQYETREETIFAVSYHKINLSFLKGTETLSLQRERNWLRPWSRWSRKERPGTRQLDETDEKAAVLTRTFSWPTLAVPGRPRSGSPPSSSSFSARQDPISTFARQEEPPYRLESHGGTVDEFVIHSDGSQEAMQLKHSRTPTESEDDPIDSDDNVLAGISAVFGSSADATSLGIEEWTTLFTKSSTLGPLFKKATKAVPREIFELNLSRLLQTYAEDLNGSVHLRSEEILTRFVRRYARRTAWLVTRHLYAGEPDDPTSSRVNIEVSPPVDQFFAQLEAQDGLFTPGEDIENRVEVFDNPDRDTRKLVLLSPRHQSVVKSFLFNGPAFSRLRNALAEFVDNHTSAWYKIAILAFIMVLGPLGIAFIFGILYIFGPISLATLSSKLEMHIINPFDRSLTRFISYIRVKCRPRVKPGHQRIEWICDCGTLLYGDFEVGEDESIDAIREYLNSSGPTSGGSNSHTSRSAPALPGRAHVNPAGSVAREARGRESAPRPYSTISTHGPSRSPSPVEEKPKKYFELCVNYGKWEKRLGEIEITNITTDEGLFRKIAEKYDSIRGSRAKGLFLLEPADIHFVHFTLEDRHLVSIDDKPDSWPTPSALAEESWDYVHPPKIGKHHFLHLMRKRRRHSTKKWLPTLPAKLKRSMTEEEEELPMGWGVHIIEGLNRPLVSWLFWLLMLILFVAFVSWSIWKQHSFGFVQFVQFCFAVFALVASFLTSKFYEQRDL